MKDFYLYDDVDVLKNKLDIRNQDELDIAEADFVSLRLRELAQNSLKGNYDYHHFLKMHHYIFQDVYDWAGQQRRLNIYKEEPVLGGLSVEYSDIADIAKDVRNVLTDMISENWECLDDESKAIQFSKYLAGLWKIHAFREGNTRTVVTFCCQFADDHGFPINRTIFETNSRFVRTALVAYNAVFSDLGDLSKKHHLEEIVLDAIRNG